MSMLECLKMDKSMEKGSGKKILREEHSLIILMKVNIIMIWRMDLANLYGKVVISTEDIIKMMFDKDLDKCYGLTVQYIKGTGITECRMA